MEGADARASNHEQSVCPGSADGGHVVDTRTVTNHSGMCDDDSFFVVVACALCDCCGDVLVRVRDIVWDE